MPTKKKKDKTSFGIDELTSFLDKLKQKSKDKKLNIGFVTHNVSDADGVGSMFLLEKIIKSHYSDIDTQIIIDNDLTPGLQKIIDTYNSEFNFKTVRDYEGKIPDLLIYVDCQPDPKRTAIPEVWKDANLETLIIDHHEDSLDGNYEGKIDSENYKSCVSLILDTFYENSVQQKLDEGLATMCAHGIRRDTSRFKFMSEQDHTAFLRILKSVDLTIYESLEDLSLTSSQLAIYASGLKHCQTIKDICKYSFIPEIATGDEHAAIAHVADFLLKNTRPSDIGNSIVAAIESRDDDKVIAISVRGDDCAKIAKELFNGGGRDGMAAAQIPIPRMFDKALKSPYFRDLIQTELYSRIINSYLNKTQEDKEEPKKPLERTETSLEKKLLDEELELDNLVLSARGQEFCSVRENVASYFMHTNLEQAYGGAITEDQLGIMNNLLHQLRKIKNNQASIVYALVRGPSSMYVLGLISSKECGDFEQEYLAKEIFGDPSQYEKQKIVPAVQIQSIEDMCVVQVDLNNLIQYTWKDDNLSRCVYIGIEEKLESLFNQDERETIYRAWKQRHDWEQNKKE